MKRRLLVIVPVAGLVVLLASFLVLRSYFNEARILALLQPRLEAALGRPVEVGGARLQAWPPSVALQDITVREALVAGSKTTPDVLVQLQTLQCRVDPGPLLRRKLLIQSLTLDSLRVRLVQRADSTWNVAETPRQSSTKVSPAKGAAESTPLALTIRSLQVRHAILEIEQTPTASAASIPLDANLRFETNRDMSRVTLEGDVQCAGIGQTRGSWSKLQDVKVRLQPRMQIDVPDSSARIDALTLQVQDLEMQLAGALQLRGGVPHGQLQTSSQALQLASVLSLIPTAAAPALETVDASGLVNLDLQVQLRGADAPLVNGTLRLADGSLQAPELPAPLDGIQADIRWQGDRIDIHQVAAQFQQQPLKMHGVIFEPLDAARARYELNVQGALSLEAVSALAELPVGTSLRGFVDIDGDASGRVEDPESMQLTGKINVRDAVITTPQSRVPLHLNGEATLANEEVRFSDLLLTAGQSKARLSGRAAPIRAGALPRIELQGKAELLDLDEILPQPPTAEQQVQAGAAGGSTTTSTLLPPHPQNEIELTLDIAETRFQLARWLGIQVRAQASPTGFQVRAGVDSMVRDALHLRGLNLQLEGDSLRAHGSFTAAHSKLGRVQARNMRSKIQVEANQVQLPEMTAALYDGSLQGNSHLDLSDPRDPQYTLQIDMKSVEAGALLADVLPGGQWMTGKLNGSSTWSSSGAAPQKLRGNLTASGSAQATAGALYRFPMVDALTNTLRMQELPQLSYRDLGLAFSVQNGRVHIPEFRLTSDDLTALSQGSIDLTGQVDLKLNVTLSEAQTKRAVRGDIGKTVQRLFTDPQGRMVMDFNVGGTIKAPRFQADLQSTAGRSGLRAMGTEELGRLLEDLLPQDKEGVGDALRRGLGGLLGKDPKAKAPADSTGKP